jgi:mannosyltransferase
MPSALAVAAASGLIALIGRRLFDAGVGLTAGLLFAGLPAVCRYGQEGRPYSFAIALAALATLMLLRAVERPTWRRWILYGLCLIGAALVHIVTLSILLAHALYMWHAFRSAIDWIQLNATAIAQLPERIFGAALVAAVVAGAAVLAAVLLWTRHRNSVLLLLAWAVFPPLFCLVTFPVLHLFLHRYLLFTLPAWTLLAAALGFSLIRHRGVASGFPPRVGRRRSTVALSLAGLLVVAAVFYVGVPGQQAARRSPVAGEPDFSGAARSVEAREEPGDAIAFAGAGRNGRRAFSYETRLAQAKPTDILVARTSQQIGQFGTLECADPGRCVGNTRRIWLITATENYEDPLTGMTETIQAYLNSAFTFTEIQSFEHARLFLLNRKA